MAPIFVGFALLAGAKFASWFWGLFTLGLTLALAFVIWLISQSIFVLGTLCPYCLVVWIVVIPLFLFVSFYAVKEKHLPMSAALRRTAQLFYPWLWLFAVLGYVIILLTAQLRLEFISSLINR